MNLNDQEKQKRAVRISAVYQGRPLSAAPDRPLQTYASVYDASECGDLILMSTLDHALKYCIQNDFIIVK